MIIREKKINNIDRTLSTAVNHRVLPGVSVGAVVAKNHSHQWEHHYWSSGHLTYQQSSPTVTSDTIYDVASLTKTLPTSTLALLLWQQGVLDWEQPVADFFPQIGRSYAKRFRVKHLLQQTVSYQHGSLSSHKNLPASQIKKLITSDPLNQLPGVEYCYTNSSSILLGWIIEMITDQSLSKLAEKLIFQPLNLKNTYFSPMMPTNSHLQQQKNNSSIQVAKQPPVAPTENDDWRSKMLQGEVHDESAWKLQSRYGSVGSAGLFSNTVDVLAYLQNLLQSSSPKKMTLESKKILSAKTLRWWQQPETLVSGQQVVWGWEWRPSWLGNLVSPTTIGKSGFTGCSMSIDWENNIGVVILSNAIHPRRPKNRQGINDLRRKIHNQILHMFNT